MITVSSRRMSALRRTLGPGARPSLLATVLTMVSLLALSVLAVSSSLGAVVAIGVALMVLGLVSLGLGRLAEALVVLGAFLVPMNDLHTSGPLSFVTAADAAFALGFGLMFPELARRPLQIPYTFAVGGIGVFSAAVLSSLLSENPLASLNGTARLVVGAFGITVLMVWWNPGVKKVIVLAWAYVLGNATSSLYSIIDGSQWSDGRRSGLTEHPNFFGLVALLGIALLPFLMTQTPRHRRWLVFLAGSLCFWALWSSGSRAALGALIAVAVVYPLLSRSLVAGFGLLTCLAAGLVFSQQLLNASGTGNALGRLLGEGSSSKSNDEREQVAEAALQQFQSHPILGVGLFEPLLAHVIYLQILAALGVVGLMAFLLAVSAPVLPVVTLKPPYALLALPALSYVTVGMVSNALWDRYIWFALALALLAPRLAESEDHEIDPEPPLHGTRDEPGRHLAQDPHTRTRRDQVGTAPVTRAAERLR